MASRPTEQLLNDPVSAHARRDVSTLDPGWTVGEALDHMRRNPPGGRVIYFYVVEPGGRLVGVVPTRRLLLSLPDAPIRDLMIRGVIAIPESATVLEACEFFTLHRLLAFPVVDADRRLVGVVDVELYTEELAWDPASEAPRPGDNVFELIGVHLAAQQQGNPVRAFRGRFPWLTANIAGGLTAAVLAGFYQDVLTWKNAVLALFIPVVLALSESMAIQSVTLAVGRLRSQAATRDRLLRQAAVEGTTGLLVGAACAALVAAVSAVWLRDPGVAAVLFLAVGLGVTVSAVVGFTVPAVLHRLAWNPQVAAGPVALATADMLTLVIYFNLARAFT